jgi:hypothetical protein
VTIRHIYARDSQPPPGAMSVLKVCLGSAALPVVQGQTTLLQSAMCNNRALAAVCVSSGLYKHLMHESDSLAVSIQAYASTIEVKRKGEERLSATQGRSRGQYWLQVEAPKVVVL